jgi:hypothetical protein
MENSSKLLFTMKVTVIITTLLVPTTMYFYNSQGPTTINRYIVQGQASVELPSRAPDYEVSSQFDQNKTLPMHTLYWATDPNGTFDPWLIQGYHGIVVDDGMTVLKVHSEKDYEIGFGDQITGYGPPESHGAPFAGADIGDRVYGEPEYYFNYVSGGPPTVSGRPYVPACWQAELNLNIKVPIDASFVVENWIYYGLDDATGGSDTMTMWIWYDPIAKTLSYSYGNYPNKPYLLTLASGYVPPSDNFNIDENIDYSKKMATIHWDNLTFNVNLAIELGGYHAGVPYFDEFDIFMFYVGDLYINSYNLKGWNPISGSPAAINPSWSN